MAPCFLALSAFPLPLRELCDKTCDSRATQKPPTREYPSKSDSSIKCHPPTLFQFVSFVHFRGNNQLSESMIKACQPRQKHLRVPLRPLRLILRFNAIPIGDFIAEETEQAEFRREFSSP